MIHVGLDDTDILDTPGTNQLARALVREVANTYRCLRITRHQLLDDPRVPFTSHNGSASILLEPVRKVAWDSVPGMIAWDSVPSTVAWDSVPSTRTGVSSDGARDGVPGYGDGPSPWLEELLARLRARMRQWFVPGSDPGLCVAAVVPAAVMDFGRRCQQELVDQASARALAAACGVHLEGLGGTEGGVIGALAAVGLSAGGNDGRIVQIGTWPDDLSGVQEIGTLETRGVTVQCRESGRGVRSGRVDVGKHLRPNLRGGRPVLFVQPVADASPEAAPWIALKLKW